MLRHTVVVRETPQVIVVIPGELGSHLWLGWTQLGKWGDIPGQASVGVVDHNI